MPTQTISTSDMAIFTNEDLGPNRSLTPEGFLLCKDVVIGRTGMQQYTDGEIMGVRAGPDGIINVDRPAGEVFAPESMRSYEGKPVTMLHPDQMVNPSNWQEVAVGTVQNVRQDGNLLIADLLITVADAIEAVKNGLREVSCGYEAEYVSPTPGHATQRGIVGNHVALVPRGRCGSTCSIKDHEMAKTTWKDRLLSALKIKDEAVIQRVLDEAPEGGDLHIHMASEDSEEEEDPTEKRLKAVEDAIAGMQSSKDAKAKDADEEEKKEDETKDGDDDEEDKDDEGYTGDSWPSIVQRAAIVAPGLKLTVPTGDAKSASFKDAACQCKRQALTAAYATDAGKQAIDVVLQGRSLDKIKGVALDAVFSASAAILAGYNNGKFNVKPATKDATITKNELMVANIAAFRKDHTKPF